MEGLGWGMLIGVAPFAWILRDGLGPDAVASSGWVAVVRWFWTFWVGPVLSGLVALVVAGRWWQQRRGGGEGLGGFRMWGFGSDRRGLGGQDGRREEP